MKANPHRAISRVATRPALLAPLIASLLLAGCGPDQAPRPVTAPPPPAPTAPPAPRVTADWRDAPLVAGTWRWSAQDGTSTARYGADGQPPVAELRCDRARAEVTLSLPASTQPGATQRPMGIRALGLTITTTALTRTQGATQRLSDGRISMVLGARDPLLDAMVFSRGRWRVEVEDGTTLDLPNPPEMARVIEDCR